MKKLLTIIFFACFFICSYSQKGTLSGNISDATGIALPGARVYLSPGNIYTISSTNGKYIFLNVPAGKYTLGTEYIGYSKKEYSVAIAAGQNTNQDIVLDNEESASASKVKDIAEIKLTKHTLLNQARALNFQRNNPNISNIVSSDQVGKFPDANIGDALKRVPGVTMQQDQGEARNIIIRGLAPELNSITMNGNRIPSAEGDNRKVQMDLIPSDMIQMIEVNKTLTPDQDADAIGGSVNLITRSAGPKERISFTTSLGYAAIRNKFGSSNSFIYSNRFFNKKLGVVANGSYNNIIFGNDNAQGSWKKDKYGNIYPGAWDVRDYFGSRKRQSIGVGMDYKFDSRNSIRFDGIYNVRDDYENMYRKRFGGISPKYSSTDPTRIIGYRGTLQSVVRGGETGRPNKGSRLERQSIQNYSLSGQHVLGRQIELSWLGSYSKAREHAPGVRIITYSVKNVDFEGFDSFERPNFYSQDYDPKDFKFNGISSATTDTYEVEKSGRIDLRMPFSIINDQKGRLRIGGKARIKNKERNNDLSKFSPVSKTDLATMADTDYLLFDKAGRYPRGASWEAGYFVDGSYLAALNLEDSGRFKKTNDPSSYLSANYKAQEQIYAGYIRWDQNFSDKLSAIMGVRLENTRIDYEGNIVTEDEKGNPAAEPRNLKNDYTNILPNITVKYAANSNLILRTAFTTGIARPGYYSLAPFVNIPPVGQNSINAGNPGLKASYSYNYDLMGEYYFKDIGLISLGGFYKKINNFIYPFVNPNYTINNFKNDFPDLAGNPNLRSDEVYIFSQDRNGKSVGIYGFEVAVQKQLDFFSSNFLKSFGVYANYTYTKSEASEFSGGDGEIRKGVSLPGTAPHMFNFSLSWENSKFSARASVNYTGSYISALGTTEFNDYYYGRQAFLDANMSYSLTKNIRFFLEANNLTNQPLNYFYGKERLAGRVEYYRAKYNLGFKFDF